MPDHSPVKITVDTGFRPRYKRYGYLREISNTHLILGTPQRERFASAAIPLVSVIEIEDATEAEVEAA